MTTIRDIDKKCAVCTKTSPQSVITSTNTWGYPDLDLRPSEMQRSTMFAWLDECPHCGYVSVDIENELEASSDLLKSDEYLTCGRNEFKSELSKRFYRHYLISKAENDYDSEFSSILHCAWACDDKYDDLAVEMRKLALKSMEKIDYENDDLKLIRADLLRRSFQFDELIREFNDVTFEDNLKNEIIDFQLELAEKKDTACYAIDDITKKVTVSLNGELHKKLKFIAEIKNVSLVEVIETMIKEKADETDPDELLEQEYEKAMKYYKEQGGCK